MDTASAYTLFEFILLITVVKKELKKIVFSVAFKYNAQMQA